MKFLASFLLSMTLILSMSGPVQAADTPGYVTTKEYVAVQDGWKKHRVHDRFDTVGVQQERWRSKKGHIFEQRRYLTKYTGQVVYVNYRQSYGTGFFKVRQKMWCFANSECAKG